MTRENFRETSMNPCIVKWATASLKLQLHLALAIIGVCTCSICAHAEATADFFAGRTITIMVGFGPGGGYDIYARALARYFGGHVPGRPNVIVQNVPGA